MKDDHPHLMMTEISLSSIVVVCLLTGCSDQSYSGQNHSDSPTQSSAGSHTTSVMVGNDDGKTDNTAMAEIPLAAPSAQNPVAVGAAVGPALVPAGGTAVLEVRVKILPGWHIYAVDQPTGVSIPTSLNLHLPPGVTADGDWHYRDAEPYAAGSGGPTFVYHDEVSFRQQLQIGKEVAVDSLAIKCQFKYMACTDRSCLPPTSLDLEAKLKILPSK